MTNIQKQESLPKGLIEATLTGNWQTVSPDNRILFIKHLCDALEIPLVMNPFLFIQMRGRGTTLYAPASAYHMLANKQGISTEIKTSTLDSDMALYEVCVRALSKDGRFADNMAAVSLRGLSGEDYANAKMKCVTKAQRRAIKSLLGLPIPDEDDVIPGTVDVQTYNEVSNESSTGHRTKTTGSTQEKGTQSKASVGDRGNVGTQAPHEESGKSYEQEIKEWRDKAKEYMLDNPRSPFYRDPRLASEFVRENYARELKDLNAAEIEDLCATFLKFYPEVLILEKSGDSHENV